MSYSYQLKKTNIVKIFSLFIKLPRIFKLFFFIVFSSNSKLTEEKSSHRLIDIPYVNVLCSS